MNHQKKIILTGGGTFGHVGPNIALLEKLQENGWTAHYIGSANSIEEATIGKTGIPFYSISAGKLRRYFSWQNLLDVARVKIGILQAIWLIFKLKPTLTFSKGGYVSFPVVFASWLNRVPVVTHESDVTPGLTTRLSMPFARKICVTFERTADFVKQKEKIVHTGLPVRPALLNGKRERGLEFCKIDGSRPTILVMGGSLGSRFINENVRQALPKTLQVYNVVHLCGKGQVDALLSRENYVQFEYLQEELPDVLACADLVVGRAGATSLFELLTLNKPHLLVPLSAKASRGDQIENAQFFESQGISRVIQEEDLTPEKLVEAVETAFQNREESIARMKTFPLPDAINKILQTIESCAK